MHARRTSRLPAEVEARLPLKPGERILAEVPAAGGLWCVGTGAALLVYADGEWTRLPWEQVERADWDSEAGRLTVVEVTGWGLPEASMTFELDGAGRLLDLLRERVTKSIAIRLFAPVYARKGLSVVGRRSPTGDGEIAWSFVLASGLDPEDPRVVAVAGRALEQARSELADL
jgi:hypothetical protein